MYKLQLGGDVRNNTFEEVKFEVTSEGYGGSS